MLPLFINLCHIFHNVDFSTFIRLWLKDPIFIGNCITDFVFTKNQAKFLILKFLSSFSKYYFIFMGCNSVYKKNSSKSNQEPEKSSTTKSTPSYTSRSEASSYRDDQEPMSYCGMEVIPCSETGSVSMSVFMSRLRREPESLFQKPNVEKCFKVSNR